MGSDMQAEPWAIRPSDVTAKMWKRFLDMFTDGARFWTSVDGSARDFVIVRRPDAVDVLRREFDGHNVCWAQAVLHERFVDWDWGDPDFFDDPYEHGRRRGKIWRFSDTPTPFPVLSWDPDVALSAVAP